MSIVDGYRKTGVNVRQDINNAAQMVANTVKTSLGPVGMDKMMVDDMGEVLVTNDGATIVAKLDVEHPAAKVLVDLARLQDSEIGDGTTGVVIITAELLKRALRLTEQGIHPTTIMSGYRMAGRQAVQYVRTKLAIDTNDLGPNTFRDVAKTSMASKVLSIDADHFSDMIVKSLESVKTAEGTYAVKSISILKQHGKSIQDSELVNGFALNCTRAAQGMPSSIEGAKIALLDFDLRVSKLKMGVQILIDDPKEVEEIRKREANITKERIEKIIASGANVIMTTKGIDDLSMKYLVEANIFGVRRCKKDDLKRIAKATGATIILNMASNESDEETFEVSNVGTADRVYERRFADDECIIIETNATNARRASIILRGANSFILDEMQRALNDALQAVKRVLESTSVVPGGGAVEAALSVHLEKQSLTVTSREQVAMAEFSQALLVIPRQLAMNASLDAMELTSMLLVAHNTAHGVSTETTATKEDQDKAQLRFTGLDLIDNKVRNSVTAGVLEPTNSKVKSIQFATEAAISLLRIDDMIQLNAREQEEAHPNHY
jgi:T-complex protein 1 subunit alpha